MTTTHETILGQIEELQMWFARKPYGWYEKATVEQRTQWDDRSDEMDRLNDVLTEM